MFLLTLVYLIRIINTRHSNKENIVIIKRLKTLARKAKIASKKNDIEIINDIKLISLSTWRGALRGEQVLNEEKGKALNNWIIKQLLKD